MNIVKWQTYILLVGFVERADLQVLILGVQSNGNGQWLSVALEATKGATVNQVFDSHSHAIIGKAHKTIENAQKACEKYARKWVNNTRHMPKCECKEI